MYEQAAQQGYAPAQYNVALMYEKGEGVEQDDEKAREWYEKSADQEYAPAQNNLVKIYKSLKKGVIEDSHLLAIDLNHKATEQGIPEALHRRAREIEEGDHFFDMFKQSPHSRHVALVILKEAIGFYYDAAFQGYAPSQYRLAIMIETGKGFRLDNDADIAAYAWMSLAASTDSSYIEDRDRLRKKLSRDQLEEAQLFAKQLKRKIRKRQSKSLSKCKGAFL